MPDKNNQRNVNSITMREIKIDYKKCIVCGKCVESCSMGAIEFFEETIVIADQRRCSSCFKCEQVCPTGAITVEGKTCGL